MLWILWQIWCARNQLIFEGKIMSAEETLTKAVVMAREWTNSQEKKKHFPSHKNPTRTPDLQNHTIVNTGGVASYQPYCWSGMDDEGPGGLSVLHISCLSCWICPGGGRLSFEDGSLLLQGERYQTTTLLLGLCSAHQGSQQRWILPTVTQDCFRCICNS